MYLKKELYELIRTHESIFDFIQENAWDGIWYWDLEYPENEWMNARFWKVLGYNPDEISHKSSAWQSIINQDDLKLALDNFTKHSENPDHPYDQIVRYTHKNGSIVWTRCRTMIIRDKNDKPIRVLRAHHEITELKQAEEQLAQSEKTYREIFNCIVDSLFIIEIGTGAILDVNNSMLKNFGYDRDDLPGLTVADLSNQEAPPKDKHIVAHIKRASKGKTVVCEWLCRKKSGDLFRSEIILQRVNIGGFDRIMAIVRDNTERKKAEEALHKSEERYKAVFENTGTATCIHEKDGTISLANDKFAELSGYPLDEILNKKKWMDFVVPEDLSWTLAQQELRLKNREHALKEFDFRFICADKEIRKISLHIDMIADTDRSVASLLDITGREQTLNELKFQNVLLKIQQEVSLDGILIVDENDTIISFNQRFADIWEIPENIMALQSGEKALQYVIPKLSNPHEFVQRIRDLFKNKHKESLEEITLTDGRILERYSAPMVDSDDIYFGRIWYYRDITEKKQTEIELTKAKEKAEESDRLKSAFLANMSHEIRTPMNGILGFADLLKKSDLTGEEQQQYITIINNSGERMLNIINDIVDISQIEAGLMDLNMSESNINEMIEFVYTFLKPEAERKNITFSYKPPLPAKEAIIKTDPEKIYAVLTNLVKNAIKYTEKGGIEFGYVLKRDLLEFYVKDTGIGVPKKRQEAIFERFIQADIEDRMAYQGAGLGLSIAKAYVEMLGGKIWVESKEGSGSTFYFTLPYDTELEKQTIDTPLAGSGRNENIRNIKTLIVDDDEASELFLDEIAKIFSKETLKARTGVEAVEVCRDNPDIDLILMDIRMPEMDGYEATQQIRKFNKEVIIIAQTAYGLSGDREKAIQAGCDDYIPKPIDNDKLLALIQKYFGR